jgi:DNA-binding PucR family transcriptional regulator
VFGPDDLLIDQMVAASPRAAATLVSRVLHPLRAGDRTGVLEGTLATWLATGTVPETARREVVHPNTVAYRLRRVKELTGFDPRIPNDATLLSLAMAASAPHVQNGFVDLTNNAVASSGDSG